MGTAEIEDAVRNVLRSDERVALGYLFGHGRREPSRPDSDVDAGVMFRPGADAEAAWGELADALVRALGTDRVDLVRLDRASPPLRYRVIRDG